MTILHRIAISLVLCTTAFVGTGRASTVFWTNWTAGTPGAVGSAVGTITVGSSVIGVNYSGEIAFIQTTGGTNYWNPSGGYISATVDNAPPAADIIALSSATSKTLTFSESIEGLLFAVVSLNGNGYRFNRDFDVLSFGPGYWGNGTLSKTALGGGVFQLNGTGEPHGVIQFAGSTTSITWTSLTNEFWNGFTIGVVGVTAPVDAVPEPGTWAMSLGALAVAGLVKLRRRA